MVVFGGVGSVDFGCPALYYALATNDMIIGKTLEKAAGTPVSFPPTLQAISYSKQFWTP